MTTRIYGIRHHGPGCANSLLRAFEAHPPDIILVEGPPEGDALLEHAANEGLVPPVAMFLYEDGNPSACAFYPFADFSPEWQAIRYGATRGVPVRFMDMPQAHFLGLAKQRREEFEAALKALAEKAGSESGEQAKAVEEEGAEQFDAQPKESVAADPIGALAKAAGFDDGERWWEFMVESRSGDADVFAAILEAMTALRSDAETRADEPEPLRQETLRREAFMRRAIRQAGREGFVEIAVVCGAWHAPALATMPTAKDDEAAVKGLPKVKVAGAWVPWTYRNLTFASGYGAGVESPGWFEHLWRMRRAGADATAIAVDWMIRVARMLRGEDLDASSASVIEAVRLAEAVASLRGVPLPGLLEMDEAATAVLCFGERRPLELIAHKLHVGERLGKIPPGLPATPLQQDFARLVKKLRLPQTADNKDYELDLRKEGDLERSRFFHRLGLIGIPWAQATAARSRGTFKEAWRTQWKPDFEITIVEASIWGPTIYDAASKFARSTAAKETKLSALAAMFSQLLLADLPEAIRFATRRLDAVAAVTADVAELIAAAPPMADLMRYGDVRRTDVGNVEHIFTGLVERICIGLPLLCAGMADDAAEEMDGRIVAMTNALRLLENEEYLADWYAALDKIAVSATVHGLTAGRVTRLLFDGGITSAEETARRMGLALSIGGDNKTSGAWADGFLRGSGLVLLLNEELFAILDEWISGQPLDQFRAILPLLRRTFSVFAKGERRQIGEKVARGKSAVNRAPAAARTISDHASRDAAIGLLRRIFNLDGARP